MKTLDRSLLVLADCMSFAPGCRVRLTGRTAVGLFPSLYTLECWNLPEEEYLRLTRTSGLSVFRGISCLAQGKVSDVYRRTVPGGTLTTAAFSLGLDLWESRISLALPGGISMPDTLRRLLEASGTGIRLLSAPGGTGVFPRGQAFLGRAADCITEALGKARGILLPAGLRALPAAPLPPLLHFTGADLTDAPAFADGGKKMILSTQVIGFQPGEELTLEYEGNTVRGMILERMVDADTGNGPWSTQLLVEVHS